MSMLWDTVEVSSAVLRTQMPVRPLTSGVTVNLHSVFGTDSNNIYAVGDSGTILRRRL